VALCATSPSGPAVAEATVGETPGAGGDGVVDPVACRVRFHDRFASRFTPRFWLREAVLRLLWWCRGLVVRPFDRAPSSLRSMCLGRMAPIGLPLIHEPVAVEGIGTETRREGDQRKAPRNCMNGEPDKSASQDEVWRGSGVVSGAPSTSRGRREIWLAPAFPGGINSRLTIT
jgi:hypothetical protein